MKLPRSVNVLAEDTSAEHNTSEILIIGTDNIFVALRIILSPQKSENPN